jgi:hypothetical protein
MFQEGFAYYEQILRGGAGISCCNGHSGGVVGTFKRLPVLLAERVAEL